jgi:hypothetical protein
MAKVREACKRGDGRACETVVYDIEGGPNDDKAEAARAKLYAVACDEGRVESCASVVPLFERCENTDDVAGCEAEDVADWKTKNPMWARAAQTLIDACNAGDALACVHVPSKRVPLTARCAANDYEACGLLGCLGVTDSAAIAKQHNAEVNCQIAQRLGGLESRRGTLPKTAHVSGTVDGGAM